MDNNLTIYLARHGRAEHNFGNKFAGDKFDTDLTPAGIGDAHVVAKKILKHGGCDHIICSRLKRSIETAQAISMCIKEVLGQEVKVNKIADFSELNIGKFAGHTREEVEKKFPEQAEDFYEKNIWNLDFPGGENFKDISHRITRAFKELESVAKQGESVLVVSHAMFLRAIMYTLFPDSDAWKSKSFYHDRVVKISKEKGKYVYEEEI